jgi:hypothetical protein
MIITILNVTYRPVFYLKHGISETELCHFQVEPTRLSPIDRSNLYFRTGWRQNSVPEKLHFK